MEEKKIDVEQREKKVPAKEQTLKQKRKKN
jgi:hypothetical protein